MPHPQLPKAPSAHRAAQGAPLTPQQAQRDGVTDEPPPDDGPQDPEGPGPCPRPVLEGLASSWETAGTARGGGAHPREPPSAMSPAPRQRPVQQPHPGRQGGGEGRPSPPRRRDTVRARLTTAPPRGCPGRVGSPGSGIEPVSPVLAGRFLTAEPPGKPRDLQPCLDTGPGVGLEGHRAALSSVF